LHRFTPRGRARILENVDSGPSMTAVPLKHRTAFPPSPTVAGATAQYAALPWRRLADGKVKVLLITSRGTRRWVIPKGWPMPDRTPAQAAAQEAYEEAGLVGVTADKPIGVYVYDKRLRDGAQQPVEVSVFPLEVFVEQLGFPEHGQREKLWISPAEAAERVDEPGLKALIRRFRPPTV
jgi:8-oxo-dGTP pyrophosphatase MutT (NUDIX family)